MKTRLLIAVPALLAVVALTGALGPSPDPASAQAADPSTDSVTVNGVGTVKSVPDEANFSFGVETRANTAQAAIAANAAQMEKLIAALRKAGAREIATQWVSVYPVVTDDGTTVDGYSASNSVSATIGVARAGALIDAAAGAGANQISGPGLSSSDAERLYKDALCRRGDRRPRPSRGAGEGCRPLARRDHDDGRVRRAADSHVPGRGRCRRELDARRARAAGDDRDSQRHVRPPLSGGGGRGPISGPRAPFGFRRALGIAAIVPRSTSSDQPVVARGGGEDHRDEYDHESSWWVMPGYRRRRSLSSFAFSKEPS